MTASSNVDAMSSAGHVVSTRSSFRERRRLAEVRARMRDLDDHELATLVVNPLSPDHALACDALADRFLPQLLRRARNICRHLGHCGQQCKGPGCEHAFNAAVGELASRITGQRYYYAHYEGVGGVLHMNSEGRARRTTSPASAASRWLKRREVKTSAPLGAVIGSELKDAGRATDVRRRWNLERGLKARVNLPQSIKAPAAALLAERAARSDAVGRHLRSSSPGTTVQAWADRFYDDACDNARPGLHGPDDQRIARSVGWVKADTPLDRDMATALEEVVEVLTVDGGDFWRGHMDAAYAHTRVGFEPLRPPDEAPKSDRPSGEMDQS